MIWFTRFKVFYTALWYMAPLSLSCAAHTVTLILIFSDKVEFESWGQTGDNCWSIRAEQPGLNTAGNMPSSANWQTRSIIC